MVGPRSSALHSSCGGTRRAGRAPKRLACPLIPVQWTRGGGDTGKLHLWALSGKGSAGRRGGYGCYWSPAGRVFKAPHFVLAPQGPGGDAHRVKERCAPRGNEGTAPEPKHSAARPP